MCYLHCAPVLVPTSLYKNGKNYRILIKFEIGPKLFIIYILIYILFFGNFDWKERTRSLLSLCRFHTFVIHI